MKQIRNTILTLLLSIQILSGFEIDPFPKNASLNEIFSINCLQMTQSQQMLKAYIMVGLKSNFNDPKKHLELAIPIYDKRMYQVKAYFFKKLIGKEHKEAREAFEEALSLWKKSKVLLEQTPNKTNVLIIKDNFQIMINKLLQGTQPLATPDLELITLTGKLCRKPFEFTIDYLMRIWGVDVPNYIADVETIITNFHKNLKELSANHLNNEKSLKLLKKAKRSFGYFVYMYNAKSRFIPSLLSKKADDNFIIIRDVKRIYKANVES